MVPIISCREEGEICLLSNSLAPSVFLWFSSPFFAVCFVNPLIKRHFESVAGVCWVTARPPFGWLVIVPVLPAPIQQTFTQQHCKFLMA